MQFTLFHSKLMPSQKPKDGYAKFTLSRKSDLLLRFGFKPNPRSSASRSALTLIQKPNLELDADQI
jgi:hypothetical protein